MSESEESYALCKRIARSRARNFYYSFVLLPDAERKAMCAIYAFMRRADDIADDHKTPLQERRAQLSDWRGKLLEALRGGPCNDRVLPAFQDTVRRYRIPEEYFLDLIDGMESDLSVPRYLSFEDLYRYCYQAAAVVGLATIHVLGFDSRQALPLAEKCGIAFQLTNILRDIREDAALGRVYFPESELERFGLSPGELLDGQVRTSEVQFQRFMEFQWHRAEGYYEEAAPLLSMVRPTSRPALWAMVAIYRRLLQRIRQSGYNVLEQRVRVANWQKLWIVLQALRLRSPRGTQPFPA